MLTFIIPAVIVVLIYILYRQGFVVTKSIAAVLFVFRPGKHSDRVSLDRCTGWVRHVGGFRESRTYVFHFDCQLSRGDVEVVVQNHQKRELLRLNRLKTTGELVLNKDARYYLRWEFKSATGKCELLW